MKEEIISFSQIINNTFNNIKIEDADNSLNIYDEWKKILCRIKTNSVNKNEGHNMADHSRVIDLKNGILFIEADHPGWIELIQFHKKYIITGLKMKFPEIEFKTLAFRLKSNDCCVTEQEDNENIKKKMEMILEEEEKANDKAGINKMNLSSKKEIPFELRSVLDDLKKSMLTNSEK